MCAFTVSDKTLPHRLLGVPAPSKGQASTSERWGHRRRGLPLSERHPLLWALTGTSARPAVPFLCWTRAGAQRARGLCRRTSLSLPNMSRARTGLIAEESSSGNDAPCEAGPRTFLHRCPASRRFDTPQGFHAEQPEGQGQRGPIEEFSWVTD